MSYSKEVESGEKWRIPLSKNFPGTHVLDTSNDATLFSSSLPVFPHEKMKLLDTEDGFPSVDGTASKFKEIQNGGEFNDLTLVDADVHAIGSLLPDDEDELLAGIMDDLDLSGLPCSMENLEEYDLFSSGGGLELEADPQISLGMSVSRVGLPDNAVGLMMPQYILPNGVGTVAGEHPYGEHPSRTLFVRNINSNVEDAELRSLFEQYGDIRTLYTACKHRGFVMISYYDIRDARTAMRALQNKPLRRRKLDIHFSIPKDNPSDKDINQGTLVVFNLDLSVSNEDLRQIFGAYGEVKEIRETPHKRHHKFIEFYDVRAAEAALRSLNRSDIAGKRIKLEPSRPGGARRSLILQVNQDFEQDNSRTFLHHVGSPIFNSPPGNWVQFSSPIDCNQMQSISKPPGFRALSPTAGNHLPGLASILHPQASNLVQIGPIGKGQARNSHSSSSHSFPEPKLGQFYGSMSSLGPPNSSGSSVETLSGPQFLWGSPNPSSEPISSSAWQRPSMGHSISSNGKSHAFSFSSQQSSFFSSSQHYSHHHVGSAPSGVPLDRHFGFFSESPDTTLMGPDAYGGKGFGKNDGNFIANMDPRTAVDTGITVTGNISENGSSNFMVMPSPRLSPMHLGGGLYRGLQPMDGLNGRGRRIESNGSQIDNKKQFQLDLDKIRSGEDLRTTLMIKNIPNKYTSKMLLAAIDENHRGTYDFIYLPIDFKNKCNVGYAFINMLSPSQIITFYEALYILGKEFRKMEDYIVFEVAFNGKKWEKFNSEKVASLAYARIQGKAALVTHFQNSSLMNEDKRCRPILFHLDGTETNDQTMLESLPSSSVNTQVHEQNGIFFGNSLNGSNENSRKSKSLLELEFSPLVV